MAHLVSLLPLFVGDALHLVQSRLLRGIVAAFSRAARLQLQIAAPLLVRLAPALVADELCAQRRLRKRSTELENDRRVSFTLASRGMEIWSLPPACCFSAFLF